ncbi:MAG: tetratricopeptide repeat protein [Methylococcaceae bacterium]|nr:tetratricopeptide repeat protein [Methylococcaceae bacterium]
MKNLLSLIVPTLCVGMPTRTLQRSATQRRSVVNCIPTQSVGTRKNLDLRGFKNLGGLLIAVSLCIASPSFAGTVSAPVYSQLKRADRLIAQKSYAQAEKTLQQRLKHRNSRYEKAVLLRSLSSVYGAQKLYEQAIKQLSNALAIKSLPYGATQKAQLTLGQFYLANKQQDKALTILEPWLKRNPNPKPKTAILLANLLSQHKKYDQALPLVKKAVASTTNPPKAWTELQLALGYKVKDYAAAITVLKESLKKEPDNKAYWQQLSTAYHNAENYGKAASITHLAFQRGFLKTESELIELAELFLYAKTPHKAAQFLQQQFAKKSLKENAETLELLGDAWLQAKEQAPAQKALEAALKLKEKASLYEKLAKIYSHQKNWQQALDAFHKALELGNFKLQSDSQLLLGITYYHLKDQEQAESAFEAAILDKNSAQAAQQWLNHLKNTKE